MGTRGTLHVYVNDELKIRQYNQWDSYPTYQFRIICDFVKDKERLCDFVRKMKETRFFTKEELKTAERFEKDRGFIVDKKPDYDTFAMFTSMLYLTNRDFGSNILWTFLGMPRNLTLDDFPEHRFGLPDWAMFMDDEGNGLAGEEGNYVLRIRSEVIGKDEDGDDILECHFTLSGDWHDVEKEFPEDYIPTIKEIEEWYLEG